MVAKKSSEGFTTVVTVEDGNIKELPQPVKERKFMTIDMTSLEPEFTFVGNWIGHDIRVVMNNIRRAYLKRSRNLRRTQNEITEQPTKGEIE